MSTGLCPPLSLTNVIQCFPRFYNITSVGQCCSSSIELNNNNIVPSNISQRKIPSQCLSLCSSNFHLTLSHLVCIEYVEHILGCYRQLLIKENELIKNNELKESSLINIQNFQH
ncbi:hypothetical protein Mgra_00010197 [Meloidogyne graminicola]|uniref:Uncharacterized protein n=1 Tax=Meloidogyne graminicola TaxID=189291 RepID=A0A8S9ZAS4_9BILA|nr:hypothetical protein Mgra_00010197 [Meloidogyne graminicola]